MLKQRVYWKGGYLVMPVRENGKMAKMDKSAIREAKNRATKVRTKWFRAVKDSNTRLNDAEKRLLRDLIALEILHAQGFADATIAEITSPRDPRARRRTMLTRRRAGAKRPGARRRAGRRP